MNLRSFLKLRNHESGSFGSSSPEIAPDHFRFGLGSALYVLLAFLVGAEAQAEVPETNPPIPERVDRIALGSCAHHKRSQPIWEAVLAAKPDLFVFLGDNVYADTEDPEEMRAAYADLAAKPGFAELRGRVPVLATWDDHDYGVNDGGAEFPKKAMAEEIFHEFFRTPEDAPSRRRPGIYSAHTFGVEKGERLQLILLDTRYFRGELVELPERGRDGPYDVNLDPSATILGEEQWIWLEERLREPADIRIIGSSIQVLPQDHHWERWENFPRERRRLLDLLQSCDTGPVLFVSGDRHMGELMRLDEEDPASPGFPVYELTTSGLTNAGGGRRGEPNRHRVSPINFQSRNFGMLVIDWERRKVAMELRDVEGEIVDSHTADLSRESSSREP